MNKLLKNIFIQAIIFFFITLVISLIIWPLLDLLICAVFTHSNFTYSFNDYIIEPLVFSVIFTLIFYVPQAIKTRKTTKKKS